MFRDLETVLRAYVECALWADTPEEERDGAVEASPEFLEKARSDVEDFLELVEREGADHTWWTDEQFGYDFWLTRRRHGAGFWDRGVEPAGRRLSEIAQTFSEFDTCYVEDGLFYSD